MAERALKDLQKSLKIVESDLAMAQSRNAAQNGSVRFEAFNKVADGLETYKEERRRFERTYGPSLDLSDKEKLEKLDKKADLMQKEYEQRYGYDPQNSTLPETYQTAGANNREIMMQVEERVSRQNKDLDSIIADTALLKNMALDFNDEINEQTALLGNIEDNMEVVHDQLEVLITKTDKVGVQPKKRNCAVCSLIWGLLLVIILLIFFI